MVSPAPASALSEQEEDKVSQSSNDSRRTGVEQQTSDIHQVGRFLEGFFVVQCSDLLIWFLLIWFLILE